MAYINGKKVLQIIKKGSGIGSNLLTTTTDATFINQTYELALSNLSDTPKENDYVAFVENEKVINIYKVNSVDTTKAYMQIVYNGANCLITKSITFDGSDDEDWNFYVGSNTPWEMWGWGPVFPDFPNHTAQNQASNSRSLQARSVSQWVLTASGTTGICFSYSTNVSLRLNMPEINTLEKFKAYLQEHPITIEYLLASSNWGGLT